MANACVSPVRSLLRRIKRATVTKFQYRFLGKTGYGDELLFLRKFGVFHKHLHPDPGDLLLYLTLDVEWGDNPYFARMLDALQEKGVCAYLFLQGEGMEQHPELLRRVVAEGHCVGNHTVTHRNLMTCDFEDVLQELKQCEERYHQLTGERMPRVLRPPFGRIHRPLAKNLHKAGYTVMHWSLHVPDYRKEQPSWEDYEKYFTERLHNGGVILQHSFSAATAENLGKIIDFCRGKGYRFAEKKDYEAFLCQK